MNYVVSCTIDEEYLKDDTNKNWSHNRQMVIINFSTCTVEWIDIIITCWPTFTGIGVTFINFCKNKQIINNILQVYN